VTPERPASRRTPAGALDRAGRRLARVTIFIVVVLVLVAHSPLRHSEYIQDDHLAVEENPIVERGDFGEIFATSYWAGARGNDQSLYRPLTVLSFALERGRAGPDPFRSQVVNLLLHLAATLALYALARRLRCDPLACSAATLLFAVHPLHVEAVGGIVGRAESMAALFSLLGLLALSYSGAWPSARGASPSSPWRQRLAAWVAALLLFLALGSKEVALAAPLLYVGLELLFRPRGGSPRSFIVARVAALAPSALAALVYLGLRIRALEALLAVQQPHPMDNPLVALEGAARTATALGLVTRYLGLLFFPVGLSADYSGPVIPIESGFLAPRPLLGLLLLTGCVVLIARPLWRPAAEIGARHWSFAALLALAPYLVIGNLFFDIGTIFAERLIYFTSAGFCLLLGLLLGDIAAGLPRSRAVPAPPGTIRLVGLAIAILVAAFAILTWARCHEWRNDETLFSAATRVRPASPRAHYIVGKLHADRGEHEAALERYARTLELYPGHAAALNERGVVLGRQGKLRPAEASFREAIRVGPAHADAHFNLGVALRRQRRVADAERSLLRAVLWDPRFANAWAEIGNLRLETGRPALAADAYRRAIALGRADIGERLQRAERQAGVRGAS
jgi:tetratricopeptide (TPR) repeat protein